MIERRTLEVQAPGEPPTSGEALDWVIGLLSILTPEQEAKVREGVRAFQARKASSRGAAEEQGEKK
jgi:hypothetical protein